MLINNYEFMWIVGLSKAPLIFSKTSLIGANLSVEILESLVSWSSNLKDLDNISDLSLGIVDLNIGDTLVYQNDTSFT